MIDLRPARWPAATLIILTLATSAPGQEFRLDGNDDWIATEAIQPGSPAAELFAVRKAMADGKYEQAIDGAAQFIETHPRDTLIAEAHLLRGDALLASDEEYEALYDYELIARRYSATEAFIPALERELEIARSYAAGKRRKLFGMRVTNAEDDAEELLIRVQERLPGSTIAEEAGIELGDFYFGRRRMKLAADMYAIFIENFPRSEYVPIARRRLIYAHLASFKGPAFDASGLNEARTLLRRLRVTNPTAADQVGAEELITRIDESKAEKLLNTAQWYVDTQDFVGAEFTLRRLIVRYPGSNAARRAIAEVREMMPTLPQTVQRDAQASEVYPADMFVTSMEGSS